MTTDTTKTEHEGPITWKGIDGPLQLWSGYDGKGGAYKRTTTADLIAALSANPQLRAAVLDALGHREETELRLVDGLTRKLRAAESALSAAHLENANLNQALGKAQGEAEGHALVRRGVEAELATERARVVAAEAMVEAALSVIADGGSVESVRRILASLMPHNTEPGPHHSLTCPRFVEPAAAQPSPAQEPEPFVVTITESRPDSWDKTRWQAEQFLQQGKLSDALSLALLAISELEARSLTRADVTAIVDSRVAELARAAVTRANVDHHAVRLALQRLAEAAERKGS